MGHLFGTEAFLLSSHLHTCIMRETTIITVDAVVLDNIPRASAGFAPGGVVTLSLPDFVECFL